MVRISTFYDAVIVGGGPAGLTAACNLGKKSEDWNILILESGQTFSERLASDSPDVISGLGGSGTLGGGKLCFPPASRGVWMKTKRYASHFPRFANTITSANYDPHTISTEILPYVDERHSIWEKHYHSELLLKPKLSKLIQKLIDDAQRYALIRCGCTFVNFKAVSDKDALYEVCFRNEYGKSEKLFTKRIIFASGRSSSVDIRKWLPNEYSKASLPDMGIRITLDRFLSEKFVYAGNDVKIKSKYKDTLVRTFCVCSGGSPVLANIGGCKYYDGHFESEITNNVNLGILARSKTLCGTQEALDYSAFLQRYIYSDMNLSEFIKWKNKIIKTTSRYDSIFDSISCFLIELNRCGIIEGKFSNIPVLMPSIDNLNPHILTNSEFELPLKNIFVIGDAAGVSRGFVQAMWSGYCVAQTLHERAINDEQASRYAF